MFYQTPPVGSPIRLFSRVPTESLLRDIFLPYTPHYFNSGTSALAAAVVVAIRVMGKENPEVILPAYGCPNLVSAVVFAGAKPVLVDMEQDRPWMDLEQLSSCISTRTVAIVAVNLFGIQERLEALQDIAGQASILLIEDSAQSFPEQKGDAFWVGDLVVISFGRGKPVSLLGGGALLYREKALGGLLPEDVTGAGGDVLLRLNIAIYNLMISPYLYWIPQSLPFLHLGETQYHPLSGIEAMDSARLRLLAGNIQRYRDDRPKTQLALADAFVEMRENGTDIIDLPVACNTSRSRRLLRYPLLIDPQWRDRLYRRLRREGLGPSRMYPSSLPNIPGLEDLLHVQGTFPVAEEFARCILTLPTHNRLRKPDIKKIWQDLSY